MINYVTEKYGRDRVAQIITFGTMAARAVVRDAGRVLEIPYGTVDRIAKLIPEGPGQTLEECLKPGAELRKAVDSDPIAKEIVELARPLEGLTRQDGIHAAAVVIGAQPLMDVVPLQQKGADQEVVTQYSGGHVEAVGLLKIDFLGLRNLDVIDKAVELIGNLDITKLPMDDKKTYAMLAKGEANGVFQFESSGMREALRLVKPTEFEDLIALVALYRPGPMQYIPNYAARKNGKEPVTYLDPRLKPILGDSYGISIYQEQSMEIAKQIGGFSPAEADDLRKAIGKKIHALMASLKDKFIEGAIANSTSDSVARQLWEDMEKAQDYSFNKSHAACYALISYRTAWLRCHHPCEYMAALISSVMSTKDRVPFYVNACHELGIEVLPPDVNESQTDFAVVGGKIRFGLNAVKGVGELACRTIIRARDEGGPFESIWDFTERVDPSVVEQARARVAREVRRAARVADGDAPGARAGARLRAEAAGRPARRPGLDLRRPLRLRRASREKHHPHVPSDEFEKPDLLRLEKETLGLYVSEHPLSALRGELRAKTDATLAELERRRDGENVTVGGIVSEVRQLTTKRGEQMVFLRLDDATGGVDCVVFATAYAAVAELCVVDRIVIVKGRVDHKEGETKLLAQEISAFESVAAKRTVRIKIDADARLGRDDRRPEGDRQRLPRREPRRGRMRDLPGAGPPEVRERLQGRAAPRLLRRGASAPRRVRARLKLKQDPQGELGRAAGLDELDRPMKIDV